MMRADAERFAFYEEEMAINLGTGEVLTYLRLNHAEADTMLLSAYAHLRMKGTVHDVVLDSEDTDVFVQASYVAQNVPGNLFIKHNRSFVMCSAMLPPEVAKVIIAAHAISGSDHTSGFYGHGKKSIMKVIVSDEEARDLLENVGFTPDLPIHVAEEMESFVLTKMYGGKPGSTCAQVRADKWRKQKRKSTVTLPPDQDSLWHHLERTNYIVFCQRHYEDREHPSPLGHGWEIINGRCRPIRYTKLPLPTHVSVEGSPVTEETENSDDEDHSEFGDASDAEDEL